MNNSERVRRNDQSTAWLTSKFGESLFDFGCVANRGRGHLNCDCPWLGLERAQEDVIMGGSIWVKHECGARNAGAASLSISSHFPTIWKSTNVKPVMFPPGCAKLETKP